jgi:cytochrome oxidase Cu insertion factor (SCO1/SenC/PrrC family)
MRRSPRLLVLAACAVLGAAGPAGAQTAPKEGDMAPDVRLKATQVKKAVPDAKDDTLSPADLKGKKKVVLFYFPKALTKG